MQSISKNNLSDEIVLIALWISIQILYEFSFASAPVGYDIKGMIPVIETLSLQQIIPDSSVLYYGYHPPLGFWTIKIIAMLATLTSFAASRFAAWTAMIIAFFLYRAALKNWKLASTPEGLVMLFIPFSLPIAHFLSVAVSLDVFIFLCATGVLYELSRLSVDRSQYWSMRLMLWLSAAMLIKYSGILLLALPLLFHVFGMTRTTITKTLLTICTSVLLVTPFYIGHNVMQKGSLFYNTANDYFMILDTKHARKRRDSDRLSFIASFALPTLEKKVDTTRLLPSRLSFLWRQFWRAPETFNPFVKNGYISEILSSLFFLICFGGMWLSWTKRKEKGAMQRIARISLIFGVVQILALCFFHWQYPHPGSFSLKAVYIAPVLLTIGVLVAQSLSLLLRIKQHAPLLIAGFMVIVATARLL
ncbi:MAG: glycosyltransferase family 39 protein [Candidatus Peribacteraceae bacterium]